MIEYCVESFCTEVLPLQIDSHSAVLLVGFSLLFSLGSVSLETISLEG